MFTGTTVYGRPTSSSMMCTLWPFGVGQVQTSIMRVPFRCDTPDVGRSGVACQIVDRGLHAARPVRHAGGAQPHLHAAQGSDQLQVAEIAEMADAEHTVLQDAEAAAEAHVVFVQD